MNEIIAVKIDEYGELSLKTVKLDEYLEIDPQYFDCKCCDSDDELMWYGTYLIYRSSIVGISYTLQVGGKKHSNECQLSVNPLNSLTNVNCNCGFKHKTEHRGIMYMLRSATDQSGTRYQNCTDEDYIEINKIINEYNNRSTDQICTII